MRVLPSRTVPSEQAIERRHEPSSSHYTRYRPCLRWEFGFTCAFCLLHETDLIEHGISRTGLTSIEHHIAQSEAPFLRDRYDNCLYACRFCNKARSNLP